MFGTFEYFANVGQVLNSSPKVVTNAVSPALFFSFRIQPSGIPILRAQIRDLIKGGWIQPCASIEISVMLCILWPLWKIKKKKHVFLPISFQVTFN